MQSRSTLVRALILIGAAGGVAAIRDSGDAPLPQPFAALLSSPRVAPTHATLSSDAFGRSGAVQMRFVLPGAAVEYPLQVSGDPTGLQYRWVRSRDSSAIEPARPVTGAQLIAPAEPGFYHLQLEAGGSGQRLSAVTLAVLEPFESKQGLWLGGYRIGMYRREAGRRGEEPPVGFLKVSREDADLPLSRHLRLGDFLTRDEQEHWPRYVAVDTRLLDKIELVIAELSRWRGSRVAFDVHSGFRTPWHNRSVRRAAGDSRHQYGDAADLAIDADGDGRFTSRDTYLVEVAIDQVELKYPDLVGGTGRYASRKHRRPYVHIDARGKRTRWTS